MNAISDASDYTKEKNDVVKQNHTSHLETLKNIGFDTLKTYLKYLCDNQARFHSIYMKLFESILLFMSATREQSGNYTCTASTKYAHISLRSTQQIMQK